MEQSLEYISVEQLIAEVEQKSELYDSRHPAYKDAETRAAIWRAIAAHVRSTEQECRKKWKYLRGQFMKNYKQMMATKDGVQPSNVKPWRYHKKMLFLLPYIDLKEQHSSSVDNDDEDDPDYMDGDLKPALPLELSPQVDLLTEPPTPGAAAASSSKRPRLSQSDERGGGGCCCRRSGRRDHEHPLDAFFRSMAQSAKLLSPYLQAQVKRKVCEVVSEAEMNQCLFVESSLAAAFHQPYVPPHFAAAATAPPPAEPSSASPPPREPGSPASPTSTEDTQ